VSEAANMGREVADSKIIVLGLGDSVYVLKELSISRIYKHLNTNLHQCNAEFWRSHMVGHSRKHQFGRI
jgi:hypothetical protein